MGRPTIHDVALSARLSLATVDRVLNNRGGVADKSVLRVRQAVAETGYVRDLAAANLSRNKAYRLLFVLPDGGNTFVAQLTSAIAQARLRLAQDRVAISVQRVSAFSERAYQSVLATVSRDSADGLILMGLNAPLIQRQVARLTAAGIHVATLVSDLPGSRRAHYVGPDNTMAGRTAAQFMGRFVGPDSGAIAVILGAKGVDDHRQRHAGFAAVLGAQFPNLHVLPLLEGFDDPAQTYTAAQKMLRHEEVVGLYSIGAGNRGLLQAIRDSTRAVRPVTILHELTPYARDALEQRMIDLVIDQDPAREIEKAVAIMRDLIDGRPVAPDAGAIQPALFISENLPPGRPGHSASIPLHQGHAP
jgi:LacI family transcriptional regulator